MGFTVNEGVNKGSEKVFSAGVLRRGCPERA